MYYIEHAGGWILSGLFFTWNVKFARAGEMVRQIEQAFGKKSS